LDGWPGLVTGKGATFSYDGLDHRIEKVSGGTTYDFLVKPDGSQWDEYQGTSHSRVTGGLFTFANGISYFNRADHLGTARVATDYTGAVQRTETSLPFGDGFSETGSFTDFTGFAAGVWDSEDNSDHFGAREYAKTQGRWLTPDPAGLAAVNPMNPQAWNRYAYVGNNPVTYNDPTGLKRDLGWAPGGGGGFTGLYMQTGGSSYNNWANTFIQSQMAAGFVQISSPVYTYTSPSWSISETSHLISSGDPDDGSLPSLGPGSLQITSSGGGFSLSYDSEDIPQDLLLMAQNEAANNTPNPRVSCNQTTGICVPKSMSPGPGPDPVKRLSKEYLCGSSPWQNIENWATEGLTKGFLWGAFMGSETGPGAFVTGVGEGILGFAGGAIGGSAASAICHYTGVY